MYGIISETENLFFLRKGLVSIQIEKNVSSVSAKLGNKEPRISFEAKLL